MRYLRNRNPPFWAVTVLAASLITLGAGPNSATSAPGDPTDDGKITTSSLGMDGPVAFDRAPINDEPEDALEGTDLEKI